MHVGRVVNAAAAARCDAHQLRLRPHRPPLLQRHARSWTAAVCAAVACCGCGRRSRGAEAGALRAERDSGPQAPPLALYFYLILLLLLLFHSFALPSRRQGGRGAGGVAGGGGEFMLLLFCFILFLAPPLAQARRPRRWRRRWAWR